MADQTGLELARVGTWDLSTGPLAVTPDMLRDAAERANAAGEAFRAPLKLGHTDPRFDGEPALGWLHNLRVEGSGDDTVLLGDAHGMPDWLADLAPTAYPDRSVEALVFAGDSGTPDGFEITALALLGVTPPGMSTIRSLRDLPQALGVAAGSLPIAVAASFTATSDLEVAPQAPAEPPETPPTDSEEAVDMTDTIPTAGLRERLGFADDADEATVLAALDEALAERATASEATTEAPAAPAAPAVPDGSVVIDADALEELRIAARAGQDARAVQLRQERDNHIAAAVKAGHIAPARRQHWAAKWDADPEGVAASLAELTKGEPIYPVAASVGYQGSDEDGTKSVDDANYVALFGPVEQDDEKAGV